MTLSFFPTPAIIAQIGPVQLHFYGAMYALGAVTGYFLISWLGRRKQMHLSSETVLDIVFWTFFGGVIGGRLFYVLVYNLPYFWLHPAKIFAVWEGGMSIHGGLIGGALAIFLFLRHKKIPFWPLAGILTPALALGMMFGRIGNFVNGELVGRVTTVPWAVDFGDGLPRHPAQLYAAAKDLLLFGIFLFLNLRTSVSGKKTVALFFMGYGVLRFLVEFFREPDPQIGFLWGGLSLGQLLSIVVFLLGLGILWWAGQKNVERKQASTKAGH